MNRAEGVVRIISGVAITGMVGLVGYVLPSSPLIEYLGGVREVKVDGQGIADRLAVMQPLELKEFIPIDEHLPLVTTQADQTQPEYQIKFERSIDGNGMVMLNVTARTESPPANTDPSAIWLRARVNEQTCGEGRDSEDLQPPRQLWATVSCVVRIGQDNETTRIRLEGFPRNVQKETVQLIGTIVVFTPSDP
jgi:hypothetical protein